ncbi:hypothetical protein V8J88_08235 [Massilia sp. W12]|uniref:hypothetical protein n=1 Tax=Massilia sp. W12 TaxID=3126507 RepID=UPI0030CB0110
MRPDTCAAFSRRGRNQQKGTPASVLAVFAESAENKAALVGVIQGGVPYEVFQA